MSAHKRRRFKGAKRRSGKDEPEFPELESMSDEDLLASIAALKDEQANPTDLTSPYSRLSNAALLREYEAARKEQGTAEEQERERQRERKRINRGRRLLGLPEREEPEPTVTAKPVESHPVVLAEEPTVVPEPEAPPAPLTPEEAHQRKRAEWLAEQKEKMKPLAEQLRAQAEADFDFNERMKDVGDYNGPSLDQILKGNG